MSGIYPRKNYLNKVFFRMIQNILTIRSGANILSTKGNFGRTNSVIKKKKKCLISIKEYIAK